jgi:hypothetical protein
MKIHFRDHLFDINNAFYSDHYIFVRDKIHETPRMSINTTETFYDAAVSLFYLLQNRPIHIGDRLRLLGRRPLLFRKGAISNHAFYVPLAE